MAELALAYHDDPNIDPDDWFEIIEGVKTMPPSADFYHNTIGLNLACEFRGYALAHKIAIVYDVDVYLPDGNVFRPDFCAVCDPANIGKDLKVHGVPDLCVEVLSPSTAKNDLGKKMELYARNGVREYWIIDKQSKSIYTYLLDEGQYKLKDTYHSYDKNEFEALTDYERAAVKDKIQVGIFPELSVDVKSIFAWWFD